MPKYQMSRARNAANYMAGPCFPVLMCAPCARRSTVCGKHRETIAVVSLLCRRQGQCSIKSKIANLGCLCVCCVPNHIFAEQIEKQNDDNNNNNERKNSTWNIWCNNYQKRNGHPITAALGLLEVSRWAGKMLVPACTYMIGVHGDAMVYEGGLHERQCGKSLFYLFDLFQMTWGGKWHIEYKCKK